METQLNISELRKQGRPLWMTNVGFESYASMMVGDGGDIFADRLYPEWARDFGEEIPVEEEE